MLMRRLPDNNLRHEKRHLVRGVEFSCFLTGIGSEIGDQIFINETENIVILFTVHWDLIDQLNEVTDSLCLRFCVLSQF